jgi:hypothetical protein
MAARVRDSILSAWAKSQIARRLRSRRHSCPHDLPGELIVSVTSYPARFSTLHLTLECLLDQTLKADRTILWIAHDDLVQLPDGVRDLKQRGLEIRACDDLRSFRKLVPALEAFPDAFIATADDDVYYPADWLARLAEDAKGGVISCHRAHRIKRRTNDRLAPYLDWELIVRDENSNRPSTDLLLTGVGGVLYPPRCLDPCVTSRELFQRLCPEGDDLWFYWCARMAGTLIRKVEGHMRIIGWAGSQTSSLWQQNKRGGNDRMIRALEEEFGPLP